jgi:hypothetical protein
MRSRAARTTGGQRPRRRNGGRLAPQNGSVTRADVHAIYAEFERLGSGSLPEFVDYLVGAITDPVFPPRSRRLMSVKARRREAEKRERQAASTELAQRPVRAAAAA